MPYSKIKKHVVNFYGAALELRSIFSVELRQTIHTNLIIASGFLFVLVIVFYSVQFSEIGGFPGFSIVSFLADRVYGLFLIIFSVTFLFSSFEALHRSYYFSGLHNVLRDSHDPEHMPVSWEVATIIDETRDTDITGGFIYSTYGQEIIFRVGITEEAFDKFDLLIGPTAPTPAFKLGENTQDPVRMYLADSMTVDASLAGLPAVSVPIKSTGLPVGMQIIGPQNHDDLVLDMAKKVEEFCQ